MSNPVFEQEKRVRQLEYELGQTKIILDHKTTLLASCEKALEGRDSQIETLRTEIIKFRDNPITANKHALFELIT